MMFLSLLGPSRSRRVTSPLGGQLAVSGHSLGNRLVGCRAIVDVCPRPGRRTGIVLFMDSAQSAHLPVEDITGQLDMIGVGVRFDRHVETLLLVRVEESARQTQAGLIRQLPLRCRQTLAIDLTGCSGCELPAC